MTRGRKHLRDQNSLPRRLQLRGRVFTAICLSVCLSAWYRNNLCS